VILRFLLVDAQDPFWRAEQAGALAAKTSLLNAQTAKINAAALAKATVTVP
jgi:hypothetical protein